MPWSHLPALLTTAFLPLAHWLQKRSAARLPRRLVGLLFAQGRRTVTSWCRAGGIADDYRPAYATVGAVGRQAPPRAVSARCAVAPLLPGPRLRLAIAATPPPRYGPEVEGAGIHPNPSPGPAGAKHVSGHVWVPLAALASHPEWDSVALPVPAQLDIRQADRDDLPPHRRRPFRTQPEIAAEQLAWAKTWIGRRFGELGARVDGAYAKRPFLRPARQLGGTVVSRLRQDAALGSVPVPVAPERRGPGRPPT